jgi:hypothetical protein
MKILIAIVSWQSCLEGDKKKARKKLFRSTPKCNFEYKLQTKFHPLAKK